ncbi:hypothetical protein HK101_006946 [Irineochytrium annulatum]|nr:hypothetical protein HK101_006946 [Irineochytrium annulatum]
MSPGDGSEESPQFSLKSYSIPYDTLTVGPSTQLNTPLPLEYAAGQAKYSLIVLSNGQMSAKFPNGSFLSTLYPWQWDQIHNYQATYNVRLVLLNDLPDGIAVKRYNDNWGTSTVQNIVVSPSGSSVVTAAGLKPSMAAFDTTGLFHAPGQILNTSIATEILQFQPLAPTFPIATSAAVILNYGNRKQMSFYFPMGSWSTACVTLSHIWVSWGTRGLYNGFRRIYFLPQIDDVYLTTDGLDEKGKLSAYRMSPADVQGLVSWQTDLNSRLPKGSNVKLEMAFNGNGILELASGTTDYFVDFDPDTTDTPLDWVKPLGTGYTLWPVKRDENWNAATLIAADKLLAYMRQPAVASQFFWCSHTFTHEILNNNSYSDTINELSHNYRMAGAAFANVAGTSYWSNFSMVTPGISGLFNGDALRALVDFGITAAVGDSSRPKTFDATAPYWWPLSTTMANNNFDGFTIVPRQVLNIYFNVTNPNYLVTLYNNIYPGVNANYQYIMNAEVARVSRIVMALSWNPYMFHQANLRNADMPLVPVPGTTKTAKLGLTQQWVETILAWYQTYATWPVVTIKMDDLTIAYRNRKIYDTAGVRVWYTGAVSTAGTSVSTFQVTAKVACTAPVTLPAAVTAAQVNVPAGGRIEQIGNDPVTVWVPLAANAAPVAITLKTAVTF